MPGAFLQSLMEKRATLHPPGIKRHIAWRYNPSQWGRVALVRFCLCGTIPTAEYEPLQREEGLERRIGMLRSRNPQPLRARGESTIQFTHEQGAKERPAPAQISDELAGAAFEKINEFTPRTKHPAAGAPPEKKAERGRVGSNSTEIREEQPSV